jgi:hypothetical protein
MDVLFAPEVGVHAPAKLRDWARTPLVSQAHTMQRARRRSSFFRARSLPWRGESTNMHSIEHRQERDHFLAASISGSAIDAAARMRRDVAILANEIGERNVRDAERRRALEAAREYLSTALTASGHAVRQQAYVARSVPVANLEVEIAGTDRAREIWVVGAHYDTAAHTPGANDNASGVAALLELARRMASARRRTLRLVAFCTEEPPFTRTNSMGSRIYARACRHRGDNVVGMLNLETIGYYDDSHHPAHAPFPLNHTSPWRPNFLAVFGNLESRELVKEVVALVDQGGQFPCKGFALPGILPGVRSSDQWSFWKEGYRAAMLTDTAWLRYRHYHRPSDTPEKLDFARMAKVTAGVTHALERLLDQ